MNKKWEYIQIDEEKIEKISKKHGISTLLARILLNRNIETDGEIEKFLHPRLEDLHDPFLMKDMELAVCRVIKAKENNEKITVYGDYDVDGITSITVLTSFLSSIGIENTYYLPNRLDEGYGLNNVALDRVKENGTKLLITVDCGISAGEEVLYAQKLGMDVIITDHHECQENLPEALAVIDPKRRDSTYPFSSLAGVGVTFKFIQAICKKLNLPDENFLKYLDIVCLGTVADIVPLIDENRIIVRCGLEKMQSTRNVGLKELIKLAGYQKLDSIAISFGLAPRINACGRMGEAEIALKLLLTNNESEAEKIAIKLQEMNKDRQIVEKGIMEDAVRIIEEKKLYEDGVIVVYNTNWHHGVIGIVASKITELYYKPTILICIDEAEGKGSGRSISSFDLHDALNYCSDTLIRYGGHEMAIGLSIETGKIELFKKKIQEYAKEHLNAEAMPTIKVDAVITAKDISMQTVKDLSLLEPYGEGNSSPVFVYKDIKVDSIRTLSNGKHLKLNVKDGSNVFDAVAFNMGERKESIIMGDRVDILHYLEINSYNGFSKVQLNVKDIKKR